MTLAPPPGGGLVLLAEAFRAKRTGFLVLGREPRALVTAELARGQIVALGVSSEAPAGLPDPSDSVRLRLERLLEEVGVRTRPRDSPAAAPEAESLRERLIGRLADPGLPARFEDPDTGRRELVPAPMATEPVILEAVRRMRQDQAVRAALGDLDARLVATAALADERTLTLTEGHLLSRIDGLVSARELLRLVPLDPAEVERALLGLLLTGRVERRPPLRAEAPSAASGNGKDASDGVPGAPGVAEAFERTPQPTPPAAVAGYAAGPGAAEREPVVGVFPDAAAGAEIAAELEPDEESPQDQESPVVQAVPDDDEIEKAAEEAKSPPVPPSPERPRAPLDPATIERRREILEFFQGLPLRNHFEVLGVEPGCSDADVRRAYVALAKKFHPDANRDARLEDMHDIMEAIFIRVGEAWEVLGEARSRASYEARSGIVRRPQTVTVQPPAGAAASGRGPAGPPAPEPGARAAPVSAPADQRAYVPPEEVLLNAKLLLNQARYWDAIQMLETALPNMEPRSHQHRGRLLLARAYSKNPNWLRRAEEMLQALVREDPTNADAHFELGMIYKNGGFAARAQGMFRRTLELRPNHKEAAAELGVALRQPGAPETGGILKRLFKRGKAS